jgi:type VI secretion system secreted protein Hcp
MPMPINLHLQGKQQGKIEGSCLIKGREGTIQVQAYDYSIDLPKNPQSGLPTGRRVHNPITITKEIDKSSPKLFQALCTGEQMTKVTLDWYRINPQGKEEKYYTTELENATIVSMRTWMPNILRPEDRQMGHMEDVSFAFEKIIVTWVDGGISGEDSWINPKS